MVIDIIHTYTYTIYIQPKNLYCKKKKKKNLYCWRVFLGCPACIFHLYPAYIYISPYPCIPCISLATDSISIYSAADLLYPAVSHCIQLYPYVSSSIYLAVCCIPKYLTVSHRLENGIWPKIHSRGGLLSPYGGVDGTVQYVDA